MLCMGARNTRRRDVGERIRKMRMDQGRTLVSVSEAAGIPHSWMLSKLELDGIMPTDAERLQAIADILGTSLRYLLTGEGERHAAPPAANDVEAWLAQLPDGAPAMAREMARHAWQLAGGAMPVTLPGSMNAPTLSPPTRSSSQSLVPERSSGMRSKGGKKSVAPTAVKRRTK